MMTLTRNLRIGLGLALALATLGAGLLAFGPAREMSATPAATASDSLGALFDALSPETPARPDGAWSLSLPRDHGAHPDAPAETWALTAHLRDAAGTPMVLVVTLGRFGSAGPADAPWDVSAVHALEATLTGPGHDLSAARAARLSGQAGHDADTRTVWIDDWNLAYGTGADGQDLTLTGRMGGERMDLTLRPQGAPIASDDAGDAPARGFSLPRLAVTGRIGAGAGAVGVEGSAWLDHFWGDLPAPGGPLVRDRMVLHLSDGSALALLRTRRRDGGTGATFDGLLIDGIGGITPLDDTVIDISAPGEAAGTWAILGAGLDLRAGAVAQADAGAGIAPARLHLLDVRGSRDGAPVTGTGSFAISAEATP